MNIFKKKFKNKKIIITGHTGFKGSWLALWLTILGAKVLGISNQTVTKPSNFEIQSLKKKIINKKVDIKNLTKVKNIFIKYQPDYIFHLAAQSLVRESFRNPINTFMSNSIGTLNVLESIRNLKKKCTVVIITSDKSYKNIEVKRGYKENDIIGGIDPYSASKGCAEIIIQSYFKSFLKKNKRIILAVARAGNVIGGGDWSKDRLVPDCIKSWSKNKRVLLRNPYSTRPWQHVLEALGGYLTLAIRLESNKKLNGQVFNIGPKGKNISVIDLVKIMKKYWKNVRWSLSDKKSKTKLHLESKLLKLNCSKAKKILKWQSVLRTEQTAKKVIVWYKTFFSKRKSIQKLSIKQIIDYQELLLKKI